MNLRATVLKDYSQPTNKIRKRYGRPLEARITFFEKEKRARILAGDYDRVLEYAMTSILPILDGKLSMDRFFNHALLYAMVKFKPEQCLDILRLFFSEIVPVLGSVKTDVLNGSILKETISYSDSPTRFLDVWKLILENILPLLPEDRRYSFIQYASKLLFRANLDWNLMNHAIENMFSLIPEKHRFSFIVETLPVMLEENYNYEEIREIVDLLQRFYSELTEQGARPGDYDIELVLSKEAIKDRDMEKIKKHMYAAKRILDYYGNTRLARFIIRGNYGRLGNQDSLFVRYRIRQSDDEPSGVIALGGRMAGYLVKEMTLDAFLAWNKAFENGVQVEPILRAWKTTAGRMRVITRIVGREIKDLKLTEEQTIEYIKQKQDLKYALAELGIAHNDLKDENHVVRFENGKMVVSVIDFEFATLLEPFAREAQPF